MVSLPKWGLAAGAALVVGWAALGWLKPLAGLIPNTQKTLATTRSILAETEQLQAQVGQVQTNLAKLKQQQEQLAEQERLMAAVAEQLATQERLAEEARTLLSSILEAERRTADLTRQADRTAAASMSTLRANGEELGRLEASAGQIARGSLTIDRQMDRMLAEMETSANNFAVIGRLKAAAAKVAERTAEWWEKTLGWVSW